MTEGSRFACFPEAGLIMAASEVKCIEAVIDIKARTELVPPSNSTETYGTRLNVLADVKFKLMTNGPTPKGKNGKEELRVVKREFVQLFSKVQPVLESALMEVLEERERLKTEQRIRKCLKILKKKEALDMRRASDAHMRSQQSIAVGADNVVAAAPIGGLPQSYELDADRQRKLDKMQNSLLLTVSDKILLLEPKLSVRELTSYLQEEGVSGAELIRISDEITKMTKSMVDNIH